MSTSLLNDNIVNDWTVMDGYPIEPNEVLNNPGDPDTRRITNERRGTCREKVEDQLEKEARFRQLMAHSSHDSAIDTDSMEWETEVVEFEKDRVRSVGVYARTVAEPLEAVTDVRMCRNKITCFSQHSFLVSIVMFKLI
jgi:hypothetical protein